MRTVIYTGTQSHGTRHTNETVFQCDRCRQIKPTRGKSELSTGYGVDPKTDALHCYACCGQRDRLDMIAHGDATLYYCTGDGYGRYGTVTNWPGTLRFPCHYARPFRHPFARTATVAYFTGPNGKQWSAKNIGDSQITHCRALKA